MEALQKAAKIAFASQFSFYLKASFFHWNVEGINFQEMHKLFEAIYTEVYDSVDPFAEKIRAIGTYAPASNTRFSVLSAIRDETEILPAESMVNELLNDADHMCIILKRVYDISEAEGEHGLSNFLAERMDAFRKHAWMLRATLK